MHLPNNTLLQGGKYKIIRFISAGGFGCTYEAEHVLLGKRVAIKEFFVKDFCNRDETTSHVTVGTQSKVALVSKLKKKFIEEASALSRFNHPNIVHVSDVFEENGTAYYVMDFIDGKSIHEILKTQSTIPEAKAVKYITQVAEALKQVHAQNRLHLDIKPGNIIIDSNDNAILIDFGASKQYDEVDGENTSTLVGRTPGYAPLEQLGNGITKFSPSTDIYALGATLYKMLSGKTPPEATFLAAGDKLPALPNKISQNVRDAVHEAMQLKKNLRPQSVDEFLSPLTTACKDVPTLNRNLSNVDQEPELTVIDESHSINQESNYRGSESYNYDEEDYYEEDNRDKIKKLSLWGIGVMIVLFVVYWCVSNKSDINDTNQNEVVAPEELIEEAVDTVAYSNSTSQNSGRESTLEYTHTGNKVEVVNIEPKNSNTITNRGERQTSSTIIDVVNDKGQIIGSQENNDILFNTANVEVQPEFPGGEATMYNWLGEHINYPSEAAEEGVQGRVTVQFIVSKTGAIEDVKVVRGRHPALDREAIRVVKSMPKWTPGRNAGQPVRVTYILPITFRLS